MTETAFNPDTDDLDPSEEEMGKKGKARKKPEEDGDISFNPSGGVFDPHPREMPKQRRRRPKMGK